MVCGVGILAASSAATPSPPEPTVVFDALVTGGMIGASGQPITATNGAAISEWRSDQEGHRFVNSGCTVTYADGIHAPAYSGMGGRRAVCVLGYDANRFAWSMPTMADRTLFMVGWSGVTSG